jgi:hypothetical protein
MSAQSIIWPVILFVFIILVAACAPTVTSTPIPPATSTALLSPTVTPTLTATPPPTAIATWTATPTRTATPIPSIIADTWASDKDGKVDFAQMFPIVGAVNNAHRHLIDAGFGPFRLAIVVKDDLSKVENQRAYRVDILAVLGKNETLKKQILQVRDNLMRELPQAVLQDLVIIIDNAGQKVTQIVYKQKSSYGDLYRRFRIGSDLVLTEFAKPLERKIAPNNSGLSEFSLLPRLAFNSKGEMVRIDLADDDLGKKVSLEGVVTVSPIDTFQVWPLQNTIDNIRLAQKLGANIVRINMVPSRALRDIDVTKQIIEAAESEGMYVMLCPGSKSDAQNVFNDLLIPDDEVTQQIAQMAKELNPYDNVILDTWLEIKLARNSNNPNDPENIRRAKELWDRQTMMIGEIRKVNKHAIVGVGALTVNKYYPYYYDHPLTDPLVLYTINDSPYFNGKEDSSDREFYMPLITEYHRPVMFLETNFASPLPDQLIRETAWIQQSIENRKGLPYQVHVTGYQMGASGGWASGLVARGSADGFKLPISVAPSLQDVYFTKRGYLVALSLLGYYSPSESRIFDDKGQLVLPANQLKQKNVPTQFDR